MSKRNKPLTFSGPLAEHLYDYVYEKQALGGVKFQASGKILMHFDNFTQSHMINNELTKELVETWIIDDGTLAKATIRLKTTTIRGFLEYTTRLDYTNVIPTYSPLRSANSYVPYIFTKAEIENLLEKADALKPVSKVSYKHLVVPAMLRVYTVLVYVLVK